MKNFIAIIFILIIGAAFYTLTLRGVPGNPPAESIKDNLDQTTKPFELSPERGRFLLTQNLAENHSFALSKAQADAAFPDVGYHKGSFYIYFAPGVSLFALPFYQLGVNYNLAQVFAFASVAFFAIFNLFFIFIIGRDVLKLPIWAALIAAVIFGFASTSLSYATTLYQHHPTVTFMLAGFYAAWLYGYKQKLRWLLGLLIWLCYGLSIWLDYPNAILLLPVMVYFLVQSLKIEKSEGGMKLKFSPIIIITSVVFFAIIGLHGYYNYLHFGDWKKVSGGLIGYKTIVQLGLDDGQLDENISKLESKKNPAGYLKEDLLVRGFYTLTTAPDKGIFVFSPIFILGLFGILSLLKKMNQAKAVLISLVVLNVFFYASWVDPWGGWAFGPRYLIPAMAILSLFVASWISTGRGQFIRRILAFALIVFSSGVALLGALTTNAIPPMTEAIYLKSSYGFPFTFPFLEAGRSSSFMFNTYFTHSMTLKDYYIWLLFGVSAISLILLFILPLFSKKKVATNV